MARPPQTSRSTALDVQFGHSELHEGKAVPQTRESIPSCQEEKRGYDPLLDPTENGLGLWILTLEGEAGARSAAKEANTTFAVLLGLAEVGLCFLQFLLCLCASVLLRTAVASLLARLLPPTSDLQARLGLHSGLAGSFLDTSLASCLIIWRYAKYFHLSIPQLLRKWGLLGYLLTPMAKLVITYHVLGFAAMLGIQQYAGDWFFSLENFIVKDSKPAVYDFSRAFEILFFSPVKEELLFRGLTFHLLYNRWRSPYHCLILTNILFGAIHLINCLNERYSNLYVLLQVTMGVLIGSFYSLRLLLTGSLCECLVLHIVNNVCSSAMPVSLLATRDLRDSIIMIPMIQTVCLYFALCLVSMQSLRSMEKRSAGSPDDAARSVLSESRSEAIHSSIDEAAESSGLSFVRRAPSNTSS